MKFTENCLDRIADDVKGLMDEINALPSVSVSDFDSKRTVAVFVDIINGFIKEGAMSAPRIGDIIPYNAELLKRCNDKGIFSVAFADCHSEGAAEFLSFPPHCIDGTSESEVVEELKSVGGYELIPKNSTNGFHEDKFREVLQNNPHADTFIVTGDCTDICVLQFCLALKTYFTMKDRAVDIVIPVSCVDTYDAPFHGSDFTNLAAYKLLKDSGIRFVKEIT